MLDFLSDIFFIFILMLTTREVLIILTIIMIFLLIGRVYILIKKDLKVCILPIIYTLSGTLGVTCIYSLTYISPNKYPNFYPFLIFIGIISLIFSCILFCFSRKEVDIPKIRREKIYSVMIFLIPSLIFWNSLISNHLYIMVIC